MGEMADGGAGLTGPGRTATGSAPSWTAGSAASRTVGERGSSGPAAGSEPHPPEHPAADGAGSEGAALGGRTGDRVDVVVLGGGPAGATAALALAAAGRRVLLVGGGDRGRPAVGEALPPAARPLLRDLGLLERVEAGGHLPCVGNVSAWGTGEPVVHDFLRDPHGPGWHLDRQRYDRALRTAAAEAGARVEPDARAVAVERDEPEGDEGWRVLLRDGGTGGPEPAASPRPAPGELPPRKLLRGAGAAGDPGTDRAGEREPRRGADGVGAVEAADRLRRVEAPWLVDATGRAGVFARRLGARRRREDRLVAFVARFRQPSGAPPDRDDRTWIEAVEDGWWYSARVPGADGPSRMVAFHTDAALADPAGLRDAGVFTDRLRRVPHLGALVASRGYRLAGRPRGVDASSGRLDPVAGAGWLAVGDAALSLDPLSSQGLLNAHYTGLRGGQAILRSLAGDPTAVPGYAARLDRIYRAFLAHRATCYGAEGRWATRPFWSRRAA